MNETLESARERYQATLVEAAPPLVKPGDKGNAYYDGGTRLSAGFTDKDPIRSSKAVTVNGKKILVPTATARTSPARKDIPSQRVPVVDGEEEMMEGMEEETPMTEAQAKFVEGLKAGADCYTTQVDGGRLVRSPKSEGDTTSAPGADEGKAPVKKMADLLKEAQAKFQENLIKNTAPSPGSLPQAKASFAEGLKNHCKKGK